MYIPSGGTRNLPQGGTVVSRLSSLVFVFPPFLRLLLFSPWVSDSATPWAAARQASLSSTISWSLLKLMSIKSVMPSNHLILCRPLLLLPSIFPSIRVFSNESALRIRWPKYWSQQFDLPFGTQGKLWRLNEADFLQIRNGGHRKDLYPEAPQHPALFDNRRYTVLLMLFSVGTFALAAKLLWIGGIQSWIAKPPQ